MFRELCYRLAAVCALFWGLSWLGMVHPSGDSLATFRPLLALGTIVLGALAWAMGRRLGGVWVLLGGGAALVTAVTWQVQMALFGVPMALADAPRPLLRLYQNNLHYRLPSLEPTLAAIEVHAPDVITLQEVARHNRVLFEALRVHYPYQVYCPFPEPVGGTAVLSRLPPTGAAHQCIQSTGLAALQVQTGQGPLWVVSVHVSWPWPYNTAAQITQVEAALQGLDGDIVVAGDFNMVAATHRVRRFAKAARARKLGPWVPTFRLGQSVFGGYPMQIDHALSNRAGMVHGGAPSGSDHRPLIVDLN